MIMQKNMQDPEEMERLANDLLADRRDDLVRADAIANIDGVFGNIRPSSFYGSYPRNATSEIG